MASLIYANRSSNPHFYKTVPSKLNVDDLVDELGELGLPTNGLKADLQARLQLAYLGLRTPEHEEQIAGWFGLNKAGLDKKCMALGVVTNSKASMHVNRRALVMKLCESSSSGLLELNGPGLTIG